MRLAARLWRIPLAYAVVLALPLQVFVVWTVFRGYSSYANFVSWKNTFYADAAPPFDWEQWRYFARDQLRKDSSNLVAPHVPDDDGLETIALGIDGEKLAALNSDLPRSGKSTFYGGVLEIDGHTQLVNARYMGDNHWHWLFPQKSWRIKTKKGDPLRNRRAFNLKNPPSIALIDETFVARLTRDLGNLTPDVEPVKFLLNGTYAGVYLWWDITDESLLRRARRMPGSIYSGDWGPPGDDGVSRLFEDAKFWDKSAARNAEQLEDRSDIDAFIEAVNGPADEFYAFAETHLDLEKFATFIAIDRALGGQHHDYNHNHKLYFDPYKGRFEPIQWDLGVWGWSQQGPSFDSCEHPTLSRLKQHPAFALVLNRRLHEVLQLVTSSEFDRRLEELAASIRQALIADGQRDCRDWIAMAGLRLQTVPSRQFSLREFDDDIAKKKAGFRDFRTKNLEQLSESRITYAYSHTDGSGTLDFSVSGHSASRCNRITVGGDGTIELYRDSDLDGVFGAGDELIARGKTLDVAETLYPALKKVPTKNTIPKIWGTFDLAPASMRYRYFLRSDSVLGDLEDVSLRNCVDGSFVEAELVAEVPEAPESEELFSFHPWRLPKPSPTRSIVLGPGVVDVLQTRRYDRNSSVTIAPGTTLRMAPDVSLFVFGRLSAQGSAEEPIRFERLASDSPWGVVSLHGQGTAGSRLAYCEWRGGSVAERDLMVRTGMVSVIDSHDIRMEHCAIGPNAVGDDAVHWGYVTDSLIQHCVFSAARADALDIDVCERVRVEDCKFLRSTNDGLDLMTSKVLVARCRFVDCGDKGISVGEGTSLRLLDSQIIRCVTGLEIKDESVARVDAETLFDGCGVAINLYRKNPRYVRGGTLEATALDIRDSTEAVKHDKRSTVPEGLGELARTRGGGS